MLALDVLQDGYSAAEVEPLERTALHRLALGCLLLTGCATKRHVTTIWKVLGHEGSFSLPACRQSHFGVMVHGIRINIDKRLR